MDDGRFFKTAAEANDWLEFDSNSSANGLDEIENRSYHDPDRFGEWQLWHDTAERLAPWPLERIHDPHQRKHLRYELQCSIGVLPGAENATAGRGFTDDLAVATWHAEHSEYPGWDVYDHIEMKAIAGGPPEEYEIRSAIEKLIHQLTDRAFQFYPYLGDDEVSEKIRSIKLTQHIEKYPDWKPISEYIVAPLRVAFYRAKDLERKAAESNPPGKMAHYSDGRDLDPDWYWPVEAFVEGDS